MLSHFNVNSICIIGDLNARTGSLHDIIVPEEALLKESVLSDFLNDDVLDPTASSIIESVNIDEKTNYFGHKMIDLCRNLQLVVNGRFGAKKQFQHMYKC